MKKRTVEYTDEPMKATVIKDFLPKPEDLVFKEDIIKVTLGLKKSSVNFFKKLAKKNRTHYQKMMRALIDRYVVLYQKPTPKKVLKKKHAKSVHGK